MSNGPCVPLVIAHRGASKVAPENTLPAFAKAIELGADMLELDLQLSYDRRFVVMHDETVNRTTNGRGKVSELTLGDLRELDAGSWFGARYAGTPIPTLEEVCQLARGRISLNLELKGGARRLAQMAPVLLRILRENELLERTLISSFDPETLLLMAREAPQLPRAYLYVISWFKTGEEKLGPLALTALHPEHHLVSQSQIAAAHQRGMVVNTWTVDEPKEALKLWRWGIDGIITNVPDQIAATLATPPPWPPR